MESKNMELSNKTKEYQSAEHITFSCQYHVIFCTKYRRKILNAPYDSTLKEILYQTAEQFDFQILDLEVMPDHVHMIVDCNPRFGIMECVRKLKGKSSRIMREQFPELKSRIPTLWTRASFISTVGSVSLEVVKQYIENQKNV